VSSGGHRKFERPFHIAESHPRVSDNGSYFNLAAAGPMPGILVLGEELVKVAEKLRQSPVLVDDDGMVVVAGGADPSDADLALLGGEDACSSRSRSPSRTR
jgi:hypothetical protein